MSITTKLGQILKDGDKITIKLNGTKTVLHGVIRKG